MAEVVARVRRNQPAWEALGIEGRYRWLGRLRDWMLDNSTELSAMLKEETGKVLADADLEAPYVAGVINFYGENAAEYLAEQVIKGRTPLTKAKRLTVAFRPYQVVGAISPWNFPVILGLEDLVAAMTAGSAAVLKPSEFTPLTTMRIIDAWKREIGAPDVFDYVNGLGETGGALIDEVDYIQFTGSERTGKIVMRRAADTLTPGQPRARRQGPGDRARRRRRRARRQRRRLGRPRQHRPDLHLAGARLRRGADLRRVRRPARREGPRRRSARPTTAPSTAPRSAR